MPWISAAIAVTGSLIGGSQQSRAAERAADTTAAATRDATALQRQMYQEGVQRQQPFYQAGVNALPQYVQGIQPGGELVRGFTANDFQKYQDPGYGFRLKEGMKALQGSAAARGGLLSGNTLRGLTDYGQQAASQEFGNAYNRFIGEQATRRNALAGLAGQGQTTANTIGSMGQAFGNTVGNQMINQGVNQANAGLVGARAQSSMYGDVANQLSKVNWRDMFGSGGRANDYSSNMQQYGM